MGILGRGEKDEGDHCILVTLFVVAGSFAPLFVLKVLVSLGCVVASCSARARLDAHAGLCGGDQIPQPARAYVYQDEQHIYAYILRRHTAQQRRRLRPRLFSHRSRQ